MGCSVTFDSASGRSTCLRGNPYIRTFLDSALITLIRSVVQLVEVVHAVMTLVPEAFGLYGGLCMPAPGSKHIIGSPLPQLHEDSRTG
jgi:hypothetical protein